MIFFIFIFVMVVVIPAVEFINIHQFIGLGRFAATMRHGATVRSPLALRHVGNTMHHHLLDFIIFFFIIIIIRSSSSVIDCIFCCCRFILVIIILSHEFVKDALAKGGATQGHGCGHALVEIIDAGEPVAQLLPQRSLPGGERGACWLLGGVFVNGTETATKDDGGNWFVVGCDDADDSGDRFIYEFSASRGCDRRRDLPSLYK